MPETVSEARDGGGPQKQRLRAALAASGTMHLLPNR